MNKKIFYLQIVLCFFFSFKSYAQAQKPQDDSFDIQVSERYKALETFARGMFYLETLYVDPDKVKQDKMVTNALTGIVEKLDPHTMVMPPQAFQQLTNDTQGKFGGVGIIVSHERDKLIVISPIEDTPAHRAGIKSGDEIIAIDGTPISQFKNQDAVEKMRGVPDSKITLSVKRKGEKKVLEFKLVREVIKVKSVRSQDLGNGIIYARITNFQENTSDELNAVLNQVKGKLKGFILDLRDNPGGLLDQAVRVCDMFIESGLIVSTVGRDKNRIEREFAHKRDTYTGFPIVTLVNGGSASASEIVAGALQDHGRALILGTTTFGKGSVQTIVSLPDGSGLKLTVARYYTPKDRSIQAKGIEPDVVVPAQQLMAADKKTKEHPENRKEIDLKGHIESDDLSDISKNSRLMDSIKEWPENFKNDFQLVTAFSYVKSWAIFEKKSEPTEKLEKTEKM